MVPYGVFYEKYLFFLAPTYFPIETSKTMSQTRLLESTVARLYFFLTEFFTNSFYFTPFLSITPLVKQVTQAA